MIDADAYARERDELLALIVAALEADSSIIAAWLAGSIGRGTADNFSDLDFWIVVDDDRLQEIAEDPVAFVHNIAPTIMEIHAPVNAPPGGAFLLTWIDGTHGPQEVDWYWQAASTAQRPPGTHLLFERRAIPLLPIRERLSSAELTHAIEASVRFSLQMMYSAAKRSHRGDPWTTAGQMMHLAGYIGTVDWLLQHGTSPDFDDRARSPLPDGIPAAPDDQLAWIGESLQRLKTLLAAYQPSPLVNLDEAFRSVERWLGVIDENQSVSKILSQPGRVAEGHAAAALDLVGLDTKPVADDPTSPAP